MAAATSAPPRLPGWLCPGWIELRECVARQIEDCNAADLRGQLLTVGRPGWVGAFVAGVCGNPTNVRSVHVAYEDLVLVAVPAEPGQSRERELLSIRGPGRVRVIGAFAVEDSTARAGHVAHPGSVGSDHHDRASRGVTRVVMETERDPLSVR